MHLISRRPNIRNKQLRRFTLDLLYMFTKWRQNLLKNMQPIKFKEILKSSQLLFFLILNTSQKKNIRCVTILVFFFKFDFFFKFFIYKFVLLTIVISIVCIVLQSLKSQVTLVNSLPQSTLRRVYYVVLVYNH